MNHQIKSTFFIIFILISLFITWYVFGFFLNKKYLSSFIESTEFICPLCLIYYPTIGFLFYLFFYMFTILSLMCCFSFTVLPCGLLAYVIYIYKYKNKNFEEVNIQQEPSISDLNIDVVNLQEDRISVRNDEYQIYEEEMLESSESNDSF